MIRDYVSHIGAYGVEVFDQEVNDHIQQMQDAPGRVVRVVSIQYAVEHDASLDDSYYTALIHFTVESGDEEERT